MSLNKKNYQKTLMDKVSFSGIGLFSGEKVKITLIPQNEDFGIVFKRVDIKNSKKIFAKINFVKDAFKRVTIGFDNQSVQMVEHILSAIKAYKIDNLLIEVEGCEIPVIDGCSKFFCEKIEEIGLKKQNKEKKIYNLKQAVYFSKNDAHIVALPSNELKISYTQYYLNSKLFSSQFFSYVLNEKTYKEQISPARTFSIYEEIKPLLDKKIIKGGALDIAVVIKDDKILNDKLRFKEEMVRHKILDMLGDISLIGKDFNAHIICIKAGHFYNIEFAKLIEKNLI
jgi:UDP-3-O-[3-hydroxymyristoyl] N-acetylglucosamine deacetylase